MVYQLFFWNFPWANMQGNECQLDNCVLQGSLKFGNLKCWLVAVWDHGQAIHSTEILFQTLFKILSIVTLAKLFLKAARGQKTPLRDWKKHERVELLIFFLKVAQQLQKPPIGSNQIWGKTSSNALRPVYSNTRGHCHCMAACIGMSHWRHMMVDCLWIGFKRPKLAKFSAIYHCVVALWHQME